MPEFLPLSKQKSGKEYTIGDIVGDPFCASRLQELGFVKGEKLFFKSRIIFGEPLIVEVRGTQIALRQSEADCIHVSL